MSLRRLPLLALLCAAPVAWAQESSSPDAGETSVASAHKTASQLMGDLTSSTASNRVYAARSLFGQLRAALRVEAHGNPGTLMYDDALSRLVELEARLPGSCTAALDFDNVAAPCADMLSMLGVTEARPAIVAARDRIPRAGAQRRFARALACLDGTGPCAHESKAEWERARGAP